MDAFRTLSSKTLVLIGAMLLAFWPLQAQPTATLLPLQPVEGRLTSGESQEWAFTAIDGMAMSFIVEATSGNLDPTLTLRSSSGQVLIANDDYHYPDNRSAVLEAITFPRRETYTASITGFGDTSGEYRLTMLPGFTQPALKEAFNTTSHWRALDASLDMEIEGQQMALVQAGNQQRGIALHNTSLPADHYSQVEILEVMGQGGWYAGLALRVQGPDRYYLYQIDHRGQWRFLVQNGTEEQVLRDWVTHPAIIAGQLNFRLAVLARGAGFDFFYNDLFIGRIVDTTIEEGGQTGLTVETLNLPNGETIARFGSLIVTTPMADPGPLPQQIVVSNTSNMVQELQRRGLIPAQGSLRLTVQQSSASFNRPGINEILVGGGQGFLNAAIGTTVAWEAQRAGETGCGLILRAADNNNYVLAYLDQTGSYGLSHRKGETFEAGLFGTDTNLALSNVHHLLVIAVDDQLHYYIDGRLAGSLESALTEGAIGNATVNFESIPTNCQFTDTWVWNW